MNLQLLRSQQPGVARALEWAGLEGWNPGQNDAATFFQADNAGFWLAQHNDQPVASLSAAQWNQDFAFIGLYIVVPEQRGKGYGWQLWQHVMQACGDKCIGLDGVVAQQANYAKSGFQLAHRSLRWAGHAGQFTGKSPQVVPLHQLDLNEVRLLDAEVSPADRPQYLKAWLEQPDTRTWGIATHGVVDALAVARILVGAAFLGAITDAMLLGHWYLVAPGLSRDPLHELLTLSTVLWLPEIIVLLWPVGMASVLDGTIDDGYGGMLGWFWVMSAVTTIGLLVVTRLALREKQYSAVMAATGLLYLAILTAAGTDLVARALLASA